MAYLCAYTAKHAGPPAFTTLPALSAGRGVAESWSNPKKYAGKS